MDADGGPPGMEFLTLGAGKDPVKIHVGAAIESQTPTMSQPVAVLMVLSQGTGVELVATLIRLFSAPARTTTCS